LDGTPEGSRVAELIATDPAWARAASELTGAFDAVAGDLSRLSTPTLPDDVAVRLDAALADATTPVQDLTREPRRATPAAAAQPDPPTPRRAADRPPGGAAGSRRPGGATGSPRPDRRPRRRGLRWGSGLALAAAAVVFAAIGLDGVRFGADDSAGDGQTAADQDSAEHAPGPGSATEPIYLATGTDYRRGQVPATPPVAGTLSAPEADHAEPPSADEGPQDSARDGALVVPPALAHLWPVPASCRSAVLDGYDPTAMIEIIDYATFEGEPAIVIWVTTGEGERWTSIAGTECGNATAGADELHRTRLD
jgi:hypothetical protein